MRAHALLALALAVALSGCVTYTATPPSGHGVQAPGTLVFQGTQAGSDQADPFPCSGTARVEANAATSRGNVRVVVTDAAGNVVFDERGTGAGADAHELDLERNVTGAPGDWGLSVQRSGVYGSWVGQYAVSVRCA